MTKKKLLLVEDDRALAELLIWHFEREDFDVRRTGDGEEALLLAAEEAPDVIILDWMIEGITGLEVCRRLRRRSETANAPIIMLTARGEESDRIRGLETGADDYVTKPFDLPELLARLRALIRRTAGQVVTQIQLGDAVIDTAARTVTKSGQPVMLTAREYALVEYLALHRGEVIARTMLYEHLFEENDETFSNLLDVHVSNIRKKLGHDFITTRRGHGYCIER